MVLSSEIPTTNIDLMSAELAANPWPALKTLREQGPVVWHEGQKRWMISADQQVRDILLDYERFTVKGTTIEDLFGADAFISIDDRQRHSELRGVWAEAFRPTGLRSLKESVINILEELIKPVAEQLNSGEKVDLTDTICRPLPTLVIARMMGVPDEMVSDVVRWSDDMASGGPASRIMDEAMREAAVRTREQAKAGLAGYLLDLIEIRRRQPSDDLIGLIVRSDVARTLSDEQMMQSLRQLLFAGNETTARWLGHLFLTYGNDRDVQRELIANRQLIPDANEEVMRLETVVGTLPRKVKVDRITVAGIALKQGDDLTLLPGAANRDPARFSNPDILDIHRVKQPHVGFGMGLHNCLGAALARMEVQLAVSSLLDHVSSYTIAAPHEYTPVPARGPLPVIAVQDGV